MSKLVSFQILNWDDKNKTKQIMILNLRHKSNSSIVKT